LAHDEINDLETSRALEENIDLIIADVHAAESEFQAEESAEDTAPPDLFSEEKDAPRPPSRFRKALETAFHAVITPVNVMRLAFLLGPFAAYLMVEYLNGNDPFTSHLPGQVAFNLAWYLVIFLVFRLVIGRRGISAAISAAVCFGFGLANHYVLNFRGRVIFPCDLLSLRTAVNVAGDYDYSWSSTVWLAFGILLGYWALLGLIGLVARQRGRQKLPRWFSIGSVATITVWSYIFFATPLLPSIGIWAQQWKTQENGFLLNFLAAVRYSFVEAPDDYSLKEIEEIAERVEQLKEPESPVTRRPENLIVIMNESYADLQKSFPQLKLNRDPLEFFHSLKENTVRGTIISPVTGGGTANVEYEYLTGGSLDFLPDGTVAYQLYLYDGMPSLSSQLKDLGYYNVAFHPYLSSGWNRTSVYPWLEFDLQMYDEDVESPVLVRDYISDSSNYQELYSLTEKHEQPTFIFNVTMQNHSGYAQGWNNLPKTTYVIDGAQNTNVTSQYFSLLKESDDALEELIDYYSNCEEDTMIVFFGDHQPPLGNSFYEELYGKSLDERTTEEVLQQHEAPFFIWANYDIPEAENIVISSNYLGVLTAHLAGLELTEYQTMLLNLMETLPVCTTIGFQTADGTIYAAEDALPEDILALYEDYRLMAYNHLFDEDNHPEDFYE